MANCIYERDERFITEPFKISESLNSRIATYIPTSFSKGNILFNCHPPTPFAYVGTDIHFEIKLSCIVISTIPPEVENLIMIKKNSLYKLISEVTISLNNMVLCEKYSNTIDLLDKLYICENQFNEVKIIKTEKDEKYYKSKIEIKLRAPLNFFKVNKMFSEICNMSVSIDLLNLEDCWHNFLDINEKVQNIDIKIKNSRLFNKILLPNILEHKENIVKYIYTNYYCSYPCHREKELTMNEKVRAVSEHIITKNIPEKIIICVRENKNGIFRYLPIKKFSFHRDCKASLLEGVSQEDLYLISKRNGLKMEWDEFKEESFIIIGKEEYNLLNHESTQTPSICSWHFIATFVNKYEKIDHKKIELCVLNISESTLISIEGRTRDVYNELSPDKLLNLKMNGNDNNIDEHLDFSLMYNRIMTGTHLSDDRKQQIEEYLKEYKKSLFQQFGIKNLIV